MATHEHPFPQKFSKNSQKFLKNFLRFFQNFAHQILVNSMNSMNNDNVEFQEFQSHRTPQKPERKKQSRLEVLHEDDALLVVNKPAGLLTLPDRFDAGLQNVRALSEQKYGEIFIVHRIDRDTSGVLVLAKTAEAHRILSEQFQTRTVKKFYHGIVQGAMEDRAAESGGQFPIDIPLMPDPVRKGLMAPSVRGKESLTLVRIVERFRMATLIECELVTGRQHQIRVHCSAVGHPLIIDPDYGSAAEFKLSTIKRKYHLGKYVEEETPLMSRLALHALRLELVHPSSGATMSFSAPPPKDFKALAQALRKYAPFRTAHTNSAALLDRMRFE
jgi:23S rRNA pseudouridine1911/1915/1917 synthase